MPEDRDYDVRGLTGIGGTLVPYGDEGLYLPERFAVEVDDPAGSPYVVELHVAVIGGQPRCVELRCRRRPDGPSVGSEGLRRVKVARYLRRAAELYAEVVVVEPDGRAHGHPTDERERPVLDRVVARREMTDDLLRDVSRVYSEAGSAPVRAVQRAFVVSRPTAGRWVMEARRRGLLPAAEGGTKPRRKGKR